MRLTICYHYFTFKINKGVWFNHVHQSETRSRKLTRAHNVKRVVALDSQSFVRKFTVKTREHDEQTVTFYQKYKIKTPENFIRLSKDTIGVLFLFLTWKFSIDIGKMADRNKPVLLRAKFQVLYF